MRIVPVCMALAMLLAAGGAGAQMYKWVDKDGKVRYGDTPPPGVKSSALKPPPPGAEAPAPSGKGAKDAGRPLTPAEQEQAFRKRQADASKAAEKSDKEQREKQERGDNCERMREHLRGLESGARQARTGPNGERFFMDDSQIAAEASSVRNSMKQQNCN